MNKFIALLFILALFSCSPAWAVKPGVYVTKDGRIITVIPMQVGKPSKVYKPAI